ncbi:Histone-lysine N-methyltransferase, SET2, plant [Cynara cardunculus var. scolymus]|uniref:Histone-lysine N-methyltransferase, SET2, plant n=1 Tax=Cynara cardunculus var. scolymus TaxID=59895 RepID=A0A103Y2M5_CYNCS|nr:Histone-lysine N-methyltransferase, SET2, plant [Cynara cardunculus var. scolymus]
MIIATMPDLGNLVSMSSLTLSRCTNNTSRPNCDLGDPGSAKEAETPFLMQDQSSRQKCVKIKKSVESKSTDDYLGDWVAKNVELGIPESKLFLPFLVGAPKLAECLVCESVIYPGEEVACVVRDCKGSYHLTCARDWLGLSPSSKSFKCPQHACFLCKKKIHLWRCSRCHLASHDKCAAYPEYVLRSNDLPSQTVCWRHATDWPPLKELFGRIPLPYMVEEFKIDPMLKDTMENKLEPPPYVHIRRILAHALKIVYAEICTNKPFRKDKKIKIVLTDSCGWGVEAAEAIKKGEFIIEYVGEVISDALCEQRLWDMKHQGIKNFYMCEIRKDFTIDATFKGNASRFLNHSCGPNCNLEKWDVDGETRVGVFAARSIKAGEPLTYDYRFVQFGAEVKCHCGASSCQGYLGTKKKMAKLELLDWGAKRRRTTTATIRT